MNADQVIIAPIVTEKSNTYREFSKKRYAFRVHKAANKYEIMHAVKELFGVTPEKCNVMNLKSKTRTVRARSGYRTGFTPTWKKAIVTLSSGDTIDIFEGA
jgi:large subunit ribosomal protein L23